MDTCSVGPFTVSSPAPCYTRRRGPILSSASHGLRWCWQERWRCFPEIYASTGELIRVRPYSADSIYWLFFATTIWLGRAATSYVLRFPCFLLCSLRCYAGCQKIGESCGVSVCLGHS